MNNVIWNGSMRTLTAVTHLSIGLAFVTIVSAQTPIKQGSFDSDGTRIAYTAYGKGQPAILIHGLTGSQKDLAELRNGLTDAGFQVVAFDVRGHGVSEKPHSPNHYGKRVVTDIRNLLDHLSIDRAHIVGYSMGGDIANKFRELYPNRIRKCVVGGAGLGVSKGWADEPHDFKKIADALTKCQGFLPLLRQSGAISPGIASDKEIIAANEAMMKGQDAAALAALVRTYSTLDVDSTKLKNNDTPTLVIVGQKDAEKPSAAQLHSLMPKSRLHVIDGVNHFEAWTHAEFVKTVVEFLKDNEESK